MTDTYLRSLGFAPTEHLPAASRPDFASSWRYQHEHLAQDGARLYAEHALGIASCRLSGLPAPLAAADVFAAVPLSDEAGLATAVAAYFAAHGGMGDAAPVLTPHMFRPYRRQR